MKPSRIGLLMAVLAACAAVLWIATQGGRAGGPQGGRAAIAAVTMPALSGAAAPGASAFGENCAACHGADAGGVDGKGPPLIHAYYESGHHGDMSFRLAVRRGVRAHHWRFGDMPAIDGVSDAALEEIIAYVRAVQKANGIF